MGRSRLTLPAALLVFSVTVPAAAEAPGWHYALQDLLTGNESQDQAVRDVDEREHQRGRQDTAQFAQSARGGNRYQGGYGGDGYPEQPYVGR